MMTNSKFIVRVFIGSIVFVFFFIAIALTAVISDEEYLLYLKRRHSINDIKYSIKEIKYSEGYENTGTTDATTGYGLNLMLIDEMTASYAKDLLTCMKKSADGKYDNYSIKIPVTVSCGLSNAETSTYDGVLLKTYLPYVNNHVVWNEPHGSAKASEMTLEKFDYTVAAKAGYYTGFGRSLTSFQYDTWGSRGIKASVNGAGNASRTKGDHYYYPDVLATNNAYITGFVQNVLYLDNMSQEDLSEPWLSFMYAMAHNRGEGGALNYMYGCRYSSGTAYKSVSRANAEELLNVSESTVTLYTDYREKYPDAYDIADFNIDSGSMTIPSALLAVWNDDWFISEVMARHLINNIDSSVRYWNALFPNEEMDASKLTNKINSSVATYSEAIEKKTGKKVTVTECEAVYGVNNTDVLNSSWGYSYNGFLFKVTKIQSDCYKNKYADGSSPYVIHTMDVICAREAFSSCLGDIIYARLLAYAGLAEVDPTNPDTYYTNMTTSIVPTGDMSWLIAYGVDVSELTINRKNLLMTAYNIVQLEDCSYCHWLVGDQLKTMDREYYGDLTPTELECAGFVCRAYKDTGFSGFKTRMSCGPFIENKGNLWEAIKPEEMQPGDVMVYVKGDSGHIMIYLSGDVYAGGPVNCTVLESNTYINTQFNRDGPNIRTVNGFKRFGSETTPQYDGNYYCLRLKAIDRAVTEERTYE